MIKKGDVVQLKSGSDKMTVQHTYISSDGRTMAECKWFSAEKIRKDIFEISGLEVVA